MTRDAIGARAARREDPRLLTGGGRFLDDLGAGALAVAFVRSPHAHARVAGIDTAEARAAGGVVAVYTYRDLAGAIAEPLPVLVPFRLTSPRTGHVLAPDRVRYAGEPVVMVVATDRYVAEDACQLVRVDYQPLPAVVGIEQARRAGHLVHPDVPGNVVAEVTLEVGDTAAALAAAPHTLDLELSIDRGAAMPMEGRGVLARLDPANGHLCVYSSTQNSAGLRAALAARLDMPQSHVDVVAPDIGGAFGLKMIHPWPEELLVPWAARQLGQAVTWVEDRGENFVSAHARSQEHTVHVGFDDDGHLLALDVTIWHDSGAYTPYGIVVPYVTAVHLPGPYRLNAYRAQLVSLYTNTAIVTPYRGAGRPQATFAMERTMDAIADRLGRDRTTVREANFISPDDLPYDRDLAFIDGRPISYDSGDFPESMRQLKKLIDWDGFAGRRAAARTQGRRVGIGIACCVESTGTGPYEGGHVQVDTDGHVRAATGLTTQGQGHHTTFAQIVGHELGVPIDAVTVTTGDTRRFARSMGTFNSRAAVTAGNALALAARSVRAKALYVAGDALQVSPEDLEIANGFVRLKTDPAVALPLATIAALADPVRRPYEAAARAAARFTRPADPSVPPLARGEQPGLTHTTYFSPVRPTFSHSMHAAIVETDPDTAEIRILRYCVVHDCGTVINPGIVEGQVVGGVAQGIAGALYERIGYDHAGRLHTSSLTDFLVPYATEIPTVEIHHGTTPSPLNPLGVKGAGESGVIPVAAVLASAIEDAEGLRIDRIPLSPNDLFHLRARSKE